jgi:50S ribosomal protein L16 3-hydroxylase
MNIEQFLGNLSKKDFIQNYWGKKHLFVKNALKKSENFINTQTFFELAQKDDEIESRLVLEKSGEYNWQVLHGPFLENVIPDTNTPNWTLLVNNIDLYLKNFYELRKLTSFIPNWEFDDIMVSYASDQGSVGAHIDKYNVFIIQGQGKRRWQIQYNPIETLRYGMDLEQLEYFQPMDEFILEPGDMLYLPPGVAHYGVSIGESFSFSIGYRSIDYQEIIKGFFYYIVNQFESNDYLKVFYNKIHEKNSEIPVKIIDDVIKIIQNEANNSKKILTKKNIALWFGEYMTEPKFFQEPQHDLNFLEFEQEIFSSKTKFYRNKNLRYNTIFFREKVIAFVGGQHVQIDEKEHEVLENIFAENPENPINKKLLVTSLHQLFFELYEKGLILIES